MNNTLETKICEVAARGLQARIPSAPSVASLAIVGACAIQQARHVRIMRTLRCFAVVSAPVAACAALVLMTLSGPPPIAPQHEADYNLKPLVALVALTTVVADYDATSAVDLGLVMKDVVYDSDFDSFVESIVQMQDSACLLDHAITQN